MIAEIFPHGPRVFVQLHKELHLPTRVLDLLAKGVNIYLYESLQEEEPYLCLSHCWGGVTQFTTTLATVQDHKSEILWIDLPPLFQDAVTIVRKLGYRYLWIDSLCIIQDDLADWDCESARMWSIYQGAELTIAATDCPDSLHRIFRDVDLRSSSRTTHRLLTRAYFFSERYLVRRDLHFRGKASGGSACRIHNGWACFSQTHLHKSPIIRT